jgi:hypothetical protein
MTIRIETNNGKTVTSAEFNSWEEVNALISHLTQRLAQEEARADDYQSRWESMQDVLEDK